MTPTRFARLAAASLALGLAVALCGCGGSAPPSAGKAEPKGDGKGDSPGTQGKAALLTPPAAGNADDATQKAAFDFLKSVGDGTVKHQAVSPAFLKVVGKPVAFDSDLARGYSTEAAEGWLKRVGGGLTFGLPNGTAGGGAAVLSGSFQGPKASGRYLIRLVSDGGWKVDWFQLSTSKVEPPTAPADAAFAEFAATAFLDLLADTTGITKSDRLVLVAGLLTPQKRNEWAPPFSQDTKSGYDFSPAQVDVRLAEVGVIESYARSPVAADQTKGDLVRAGMKKPFTLKLAKGSAAGQWLVADFAVN